MKLIIEIPEEVLKTRRYTDFFGCGSTMLTAMLDSGTPFDDVLDEIRAEIPKLVCCENEYRQALVKVADVIKCIDKYRAEKKGGKE